MTLSHVELMVNEFLVVFLNLLHLSHLQHVIAMIHELTERVERAHHLIYIGDDRLVVILRKCSHEVRSNLIVDRKLHLLRVYEHKLKFVWMLLVE